MRINLKATNISLTPEIEVYLDKRLSALDKLIDITDPALKIDAELARTTKHHQSGDIFMAEVTLHSGKDVFRAVSERSDLFSAIDGVKDELTQSLRSYKGRRLSLLRRGGQRIKQMIRGWRR